jgi:hypothetical protein
MIAAALSNNEDSPSFSAKVMVTKPVWVDSQMISANEAGIEVPRIAGHKEKLECPVSTDEPRYALRQRQTLVP